MKILNYMQDKKRGFSLVEVTVAIFIAAIGLPAIAYVFSSSSANGSDEKLTERAYLLANSLMNEVSVRRFRESAAAPGNGVDTGETSNYDRSNFDDIDDYNIFNTVWGELSPPRDMTGQAVANSTQFKQWVSVVNVSSPSSPNARQLTAVGDGSTNTKLVTVKISWNSGKRVVLLTKLFSLP